MGKGLSILGFILIIAGLGVAVFTVFMFVKQVTLIDLLPAAQQYFMGAILAIIFIFIGFLILLE
jgi:hypothetical protein